MLIAPIWYLISYLEHKLVAEGIAKICKTTAPQATELEHILLL
jgi:hypothetical protein